MYIHQVEQFFKDKENVPCPLTERLIKAGYQQTGDGYIKLSNRIITSAIKTQPSSKPKYDRRKWNQEIRDVCFNKVVNVVERQNTKKAR